MLRGVQSGVAPELVLSEAEGPGSLRACPEPALSLP